MKKRKSKKSKDKTVAGWIRTSGQYRKWRQEQVARYGGKCWITGTKSRYLHVHHVTSNFYTILLRVMKRNRVPYYTPIKNIPRARLNRILREFWEVHKSVRGVPLLRRLHNKFHRVYGSFDNTPSQLKQFKSEILGRRKK